MEASKRVVFVSVMGRDDGKPRTRRKRALGCVSAVAPRPPRLFQRSPSPLPFGTRVARARPPPHSLTPSVPAHPASPRQGGRVRDLGGVLRPHQGPAPAHVRARHLPRLDDDPARVHARPSRHRRSRRGRRRSRARERRRFLGRRREPNRTSTGGERAPPRAARDPAETRRYPPRVGDGRRRRGRRGQVQEARAAAPAARADVRAELGVGDRRRRRRRREAAARGRRRLEG